MNSATFDCGSSSTESLTLFSAKANPFRAPTSNELRAIDYLDICWRPNQSCKDDFALPLMLSASASRRTSATSVSHYSAADVTEQQQSPQKQHQPLKRTACSCQSLGDNDDEGSIEFIDTTDDEEKENRPTRYTSLPTFDKHETPIQTHPPEGPIVPPQSPPLLYPNCDATVWLRSCQHEITEPLAASHHSGRIPDWLHGSLLRNGPGNLNVGAMRFNHLFDSSALLHRFAIDGGRCTYQCRFIQTDTYKRNMRAQRIVVSEFGTSSVPDPCHTIFQRIAAAFAPGEWSDNAMISIYPFGDEYFAFTEYPIIHAIDVATLETRRKLNVKDYTGVMSHTSHPHVLPDGTVFNLGMTVRPNGPQYNIIQFPPKAPGADRDAMFRAARVVAAVPCRWKLHPGYMHTFGLTERYFVIVEQPLSVSVPEMLRSQMRSQPMAGNFRWFAEQPTCVYVLSRETGKLVRTFEADAFFYLHIINVYEVADSDSDEEYVVLDICCYRDPKMLDCMYIEAMESMQQNPDYARMFRGRPMRFVLPMQPSHSDCTVPASDVTPVPQQVSKGGSMQQLRRSISIASLLLAKLGGGGPAARRAVTKMTRSMSEQRAFRYRSMGDAIDRMGRTDTDDGRDEDFEVVADDDDAACDAEMDMAPNLVRLTGTTAEAYHRRGSEHVFCKPERLCDLGCETPRIYYERYMGKPYRYFYAISSDVDAENSGTLIKVDVLTKTSQTWCEPNCYPSEPIFVPSPNCTTEDDGVVLAAMVWGGLEVNRVGLLVLCARTWSELGRSEFRTPGPVPKCLHGWFAAA